MGSGERRMKGSAAADVRATLGANPVDPDRPEPDATTHLDDVLKDIGALLSADVSRRQENLQRRAADQELVQKLAASDFGGRLYRRFEDELARYGISVLCGWMHSGYIFTLLYNRGFSLHPSDREREELYRDSEVREDLANMTIARALPRFRQHALIEGGWRYDGGASLTTYFMGWCLLVFRDEFRIRRSSQRRWRAAIEAETTRLEPEAAKSSDPSLLAVGNIRVQEVLSRIKDERTKAAVVLRLDGYSHEEIRELLDEATERGIEAVLYRWRRKEQQREGGDRDE